MAISVIITNFNGARFLPKLIDSLKNQRNVEKEIIVIDKNSTDDSLRILRLHPDIKIIQLSSETSMAFGFSAGAKVAKHEHFFFCNEDMWLAPDCLMLLESQINLAKRICASDPWQWDYDGGKCIHQGTGFKKTLFEINSPNPFYSLCFTVKSNSGKKIPFPCVGAFLIHRKVFDELGGWDNSFFLELEDIDLFLRAWQKNWFCVTVPEAKIYHYVGGSMNHMVTTRKRTVGELRYISSRASLMIIGIKYYSPYFFLISFFNWFIRFFSHIVRLQFKKMVLDLLAVEEFLRRLKAALEFRKNNSSLNKEKPGEKYFMDKDFLVSI